MPDIVRTKKYKDDVILVSYNNIETGVKADFLSIKFPENERKALGAKISTQEVSGQYAKEQTGNRWETFVFTPTPTPFAMLPIETLKEVIARGVTKASGAVVLTSNVTSPTLISDKSLFDSEPLQVCPNCSTLIIQENAKFCPSCGKELKKGTASHPTKLDNRKEGQ
jgi:hypothetical protein